MKYYTLKQLKIEFGVPEVTLRLWIKRGELKAHQLKKHYPLVISQEAWLDVPAFRRAKYIK